MLERDVEKKVKEYARSKGFLAYKFTSPGHAFCPDGLFISPSGKVFFCEFKRPGGKMTAGQERERDRIEKQGVTVWLVDNVESGKAMVEAYL